MVARIGGLSRFNGEALEKANDHFKQGHLRQTNMRDLKVSLQVQLRRQVALRNQALRRKERNSVKEPKQGCKGPYRGYRARDMAAQRSSDSVEATSAATTLYADPRAEMTPSELRDELNELTNTSKLIIGS